MKKTILLLPFILLFTNLALAETVHYYEFNVVYNNSYFSYNSLSVQTLQEGQEIWNFPGLYQAEVVSSDQKVLNYSKFDLPRGVFFDNFDENGSAVSGGSIILNETEARIHLPYFDNAKEINIYDENDIKKLTIDVSMYSKNITAAVWELKPAPIESIIGKPITSEKDRLNRIVAVVIISVLVIIVEVIIIKTRKKEE